jgi:hypothetical protein
MKIKRSEVYICNGSARITSYIILSSASNRCTFPEDVEKRRLSNRLFSMI